MKICVFLTFFQIHGFALSIVDVDVAKILDVIFADKVLGKVISFQEHRRVKLEEKVKY
jgi:hypothetical protein